MVDGERQVLPFMLDMTGALQERAKQIFYTVIPVFLFAAFNMIRALYRMMDRSDTPFTRSFAHSAMPMRQSSALIKR